MPILSEPPNAMHARYDPYAGDSEKKDTGVSAAGDSSAHESFKGLLALARITHGSQCDDRGGWKGNGRLKGGWAAGKDLGEVVDEKAPVAEMPSSTDSDSDDSDDSEADSPGIAADRADSSGAEKKRKREKSEKKSKSEKSARDALSPPPPHALAHTHTPFCISHPQPYPNGPKPIHVQPTPTRPCVQSIRSTRRRRRRRRRRRARRRRNTRSVGTTKGDHAGRARHACREL